MNNERFFTRLLTAAAVCAMLMLPCGCSEEPADAPVLPSAPSVSFTDVSGSDMSGWIAEIDEDLLAPVYTLMDNATAIEQRDIDAYMATIDPECDAYESTREDAEYMFAHYRLSVSIDDLSIESSNADTAVISVTQTTLPVFLPEEPVSGTDVSGTDVSTSDVSTSDVSASDIRPLSGKDLTEKFTPCITRLTHSLTLRDGRWFITSTVVDSYQEITSQSELPVSTSDAVSATDINQ